MSDENYSKSDNIVCAFVCHFETRSGPCIEWSSYDLNSGLCDGCINKVDTSIDYIPQAVNLGSSLVDVDITNVHDNSKCKNCQQVLKNKKIIDLNGIEFRCIPSSGHNIEKDLIFFRHISATKELNEEENDISMYGWYGIAAYNRLNTSDSNERFYRMRSVGALCYSLKQARLLSEELQKLASDINNDKWEDDNSNRFLNVAKFFQTCKHRSTFPSQTSLSLPMIPSTFTSQDRKELSAFLKLLGPSIFVIWKSLLLHQRVLFFSGPSLAITCIHMYWSQFIVAHDGLDIVTPPFLYSVDVIDRERLTGMTAQGYMALTSNSIFRERRESWDILVDGSSVIINDSPSKQWISITKNQTTLQQAIGLTASDHKRFNNWTNHHSANDSISFFQFFSKLNTELFNTMDRWRDEDVIVTRALLNEKCQSFPLFLQGVDIHFIIALNPILFLDLRCQQVVPGFGDWATGRGGWLCGIDNMLSVLFSKRSSSS